MPRLAFYRVLTDVTDLRLPSGESSHMFSQELDCELTGDVELDESDLRPLLCFQMDPKNAENRKLEVFIRATGDRKLCSYTLTGDAMRWTMEPVKPELIRGQGHFKIIFKIDDEGDGEVYIRNVVLFFHRHIS